jgi:iron complex outermembrane receptor protein
MAQQTVKGKVTSSDDGSAIPGVNVLEKGTANGTVTDGDGNFTITVGANATLTFSFVGFKAQEVLVGTQTTVNATLASDVTALSEVVVVGYGSQEKKEITGSVVSLDTKDFNKGMVNDPTMLMQGKVAGLSIYNKGGDPNGSPVIRLRGISTLGSNNSPLIVVDGVLGATLENIDPNDIATVNVLKDGSAAAIYGSRGSAGVILITTKRGSKKGGLGVTYNSSVSAQSIYRTIPVMSPDQYVAAGGNDLGSRTNWQDLVTQTGVSTVQNLAISGGNENTTFRMSTNLRNVSGILKNSGFDRTNTRANLTHTALDGRLKADMNMSFTTQNSDLSFSEALRYAALYNPTAPVYFPNGSYYQAVLFDNYNPVAIINQNTATRVKKNLNYGIKLDYQLIKGLTLTLNYGQQYTDQNDYSYFSINSLWRGYNSHGLAKRFVSDQYFTLLEGYANYTKNFNKLDLSVTGGYSYQEDQYKDLTVNLGNFPNDQLGANALQNSGNLVTGVTGAGGNNSGIYSSATPKNKIIAFFGRVNLQYDKGIYLNASVRREGSTKLGANDKWGLFPSVGAGVDLNQYLQLPKVSQLKFRLGFGVTGSLPGAAGYSQSNFVYSSNGGGAIGQLPGTGAYSPNPDLKWETKTELNGGIDFGLFDGKLTGSLDVYNRTIKDFVLPVTVSPTQFPGGLQYRNLGSINTPGIELALNYNDIQIGELRWTPGIVVSHYATTLKSYNLTGDPSLDSQAHMRTTYDFGSPGQNGTYTNRIKVGEKIGQIWGPVFDHVSMGSGAGDGNQAKGQPVFKDLNGDGVVDFDPSHALTSPDFKQLGNGIPSLELGWSNRLTYRNWDFNVFFRGAFGHSLVNQFRAFYEPIDPGAINSYNRVITKLAPTASDGTPLTGAKYSSLYVEKADFLKLDNMTIGYNFKFSSNGSFKSLRMFVSGQNLFVITKYKGIDPEPVLLDYGSTDNGAFQATTPDPLAPGVDRRNNYFSSRTYTFGVSFGF